MIATYKANFGHVMGLKIVSLGQWLWITKIVITSFWIGVEMQD